MPVRTGVITATGRITQFFGANAPFNLSLYGFGTATVTLERRFPGEVATLTDRLLTEDEFALLAENGDQLVTEGAEDDGGWRITDTFTADVEAVVDCVGETEFALNCTAYTDGPIEYRLG